MLHLREFLLFSFASDQDPLRPGWTPTTLYPLGFGLSYTKFKYDNLKLKTSRISAGESLTISADVTNVGDRAGDEVVQLYVTHLAASIPVPIRGLAGFKRVTLKTGETQRVSFTLSPEHLGITTDDGKRMVEPGEFALSVGGGQPNVKQPDAAFVQGRFRVVGKPVEIPWQVKVTQSLLKN